ncbi:hypothetical protein LAZ67_11002027 [Cordylochernes scorpioides]|uniref:Uncharacterized protein n=1 Tax=Cordylochernes scorpioides TaxID=51811 RepID=A0ABY6KYV3_9ARAC|nr:hypothetical protein LAZ67_11002027 [Cordylochernes scorpioides]
MAYVNFARNCTEQLRQKVTDELWVLSVFEHGSFTILRCQWSKHSESSAPSKSTIPRIIKKIETTGSVADLPRSGRPHFATCETNINIVRASLEASPQNSTRRLSQELKIPRTSIQRMLKDLGYKPHIPKLINVLHEDDWDKMMEFCEKMLEMIKICIIINKIKEDEFFKQF